MLLYLLSLLKKRWMIPDFTSIVFLLITHHLFLKLNTKIKDDILKFIVITNYSSVRIFLLFWDVIFKKYFILIKNAVYLQKYTFFLPESKFNVFQIDLKC